MTDTNEITNDSANRIGHDDAIETSAVETNGTETSGAETTGIATTGIATTGIETTGIETNAVDACRAIIVASFPELANAQFTLLTMGWHSTAVDVDDRLMFKFPKHDVAERALRREASLLAVVRPVLTMSVPDIELHHGPPLFSRHEKLHGEHLVTADYDRLSEAARTRMAGELARFYAELHALDRAAMEAAGAEPIAAWQPIEAIRAKALPVLSAATRAFGEATLAAFDALPPDPYGTTYGFFDGHGWNMAFDHARSRLNGIYDFADSGFGPLHREFIYSNLISPDLTARIVTAYESLTGRSLDRARIATLTAVHRLSELAELADDPAQVRTMVENVERWAAQA